MSKNFKISKEIKEYRTKEEIDLASSILEQLKGKSHSEVKSLANLIILLSSENAKI
ncbi:hypothetical protein [Flavobacterium sp.]|uniref:hypothetical protein n=1 Tax=Flavobacterium sp. TaxID=239 RepID=UPI004048740E